MSYQPSKIVLGATPSLWIALSRDPVAIDALTARDPDWRPLTPRPGFAPWTDDYSTILPLMKMFG